MPKKNFGLMDILYVVSVRLALKLSIIILSIKAKDDWDFSYLDIGILNSLKNRKKISYLNKCL